MIYDPGIITNAPNLTGLFLDSDEVLSDLPDRATGVLLGLAVGNLLGLEMEGWPRTLIAVAYPDGVREIAPAEKFKPMDDDLAQAVELGEALLHSDDPVNDFAGRLVRWRRENGRGMGSTTRAAIGLLEENCPPPEAARIVYEDRDGIAPNGGLMRCAPVALYHHSNPKVLVRASAATCAVTHYAPACQWSCVILNTAIALLLKGVDPSPSRLAEAAVADGAPAQVGKAISMVGDAIDDLELDEGLIGHTLWCLQAGIWALRTPLNFEEALVAIVSAGGDTDTNGAVAGAVLGARYGVRSIPERWLDCIPQRERLEKLAADLGAGGV